MIGSFCANLSSQCDLLKAKVDSGVRVNKHITSYDGPNDFENVAECTYD